MCYMTIQKANALARDRADFVKFCLFCNNTKKLPANEKYICEDCEAKGLTIDDFNKEAING